MLKLITVLLRDWAHFIKELCKPLRISNLLPSNNPLMSSVETLQRWQLVIGLLGPFASVLTIQDTSLLLLNQSQIFH